MSRFLTFDSWGNDPVVSYGRFNFDVQLCADRLVPVDDFAMVRDPFFKPLFGLFTFDESGVKDTVVAGCGACAGEVGEGVVHIVKELVVVAERFDLECGEEVVSALVFVAGSGDPDAGEGLAHDGANCGETVAFVGAVFASSPKGQEEVFVRRSYRLVEWISVGVGDPSGFERDADSSC